MCVRQGRVRTAHDRGRRRDRQGRRCQKVIFTGLVQIQRLCQPFVTENIISIKGLMLICDLGRPCIICVQSGLLRPAQATRVEARLAGAAASARTGAAETEHRHCGRRAVLLGDGRWRQQHGLDRVGLATDGKLITNLRAPLFVLYGESQM